MAQAANKKENKIGILRIAEILLGVFTVYVTIQSKFETQANIVRAFIFIAFSIFIIIILEIIHSKRRSSFLLYISYAFTLLLITFIICCFVAILFNPLVLRDFKSQYLDPLLLVESDLITAKELDYQIISINSDFISKEKWVAPNGVTFPKQKFNVNYPEISMPNQSEIELNVNSLIKRKYLDYFRLDVVDMKRSPFDGKIKSQFENVYRMKNLIGLKIFIESYGLGAANINKEYKLLNINLENGEIFEFKDLFRSWNKEQIVSLIHGYLIMKYPNELIDLEYLKNMKEKRWKFHLDKNGIIIIFNKGEIAANVAGPLEAYLSFNEIRDFINPNGPISFIK